MDVIEQTTMIDPVINQEIIQDVEPIEPVESMKPLSRFKIRYFFLDNIRNIKDKQSLEFFLKILIGDRYDDVINIYAALLKEYYGISSETYFSNRSLYKYKNKLKELKLSKTIAKTIFKKPKKKLYGTKK